MKTNRPFLLKIVLAFALVAPLTGWAGGGTNQPRDFVFCMTSDPHIGFSSTNSKLPFTQKQVVAQSRATIAEMISLIGQPYPTVGSAGLPPGRIAKPLGMIVAGDLTDEGAKARYWPMFEQVFPAAGLDQGTIPLYLGLGNHDGTTPGRAVVEGVIARNRQREQAGQLDAISTNGLHYAWTWQGVHFICVNLCPADTTDSETPFKYGHTGPGSWNDPRGALTFLTNYLHEHVGTNGDPVIIWSHYGYDEGFSIAWNWWSAKQRRAFYDVIKDYNVVALLHGHTHAAARYQWPDPVNDSKEVRRLFGDKPPANLRTFDVFSGGSFGAGSDHGGTFYMFRIYHDELIAAHHDTHGWGKDPQLFLIKSMLFQPLTR